jgi:hypothetical protein
MEFMESSSQQPNGSNGKATHREIHRQQKIKNGDPLPDRRWL